MVDKLVETVEVRTYLQRLRCLNSDCKGSLEFDGKTRTEGGVHGGVPEHRHRCTVCAFSLWSTTQYPKTVFKPVTVVNQVVQTDDNQAPVAAEKLSVKKQPKRGAESDSV